MKTMACPDTEWNPASRSNATDNRLVMQVVPVTDISSPADPSPLRITHKCPGKKCDRWQQNHCSALKNGLDLMQQKEKTNQPFGS